MAQLAGIRPVLAPRHTSGLLLTSLVGTPASRLIPIFRDPKGTQKSTYISVYAPALKCQNPPLNICTWPPQESHHSKASIHEKVQQRSINFSTGNVMGNGYRSTRVQLYKSRQQTSHLQAASMSRAFSPLPITPGGECPLPHCQHGHLIQSHTLSLIIAAAAIRPSQTHPTRGPYELIILWLWSAPLSHHTPR